MTESASLDRLLMPFVSVIVPAHNAAGHLQACLAALAETRYRPYEVIVVDDASTDEAASVAERAGARVVSTHSQDAGAGSAGVPPAWAGLSATRPRLFPYSGGAPSLISQASVPPTLLTPAPKGPAAARNRGAAVARGEVLFFVDADVVVRPETVGQVAAAFAADRELAALFGSYDDAPADPGFLSQYRNLFHHFVHQRASEAATTFWSGCGAVRSDVFLAAGGFDAARYPRPAIEDIDLGYRLSAAGCRLRLLKSLQVQHRKRWTLAAMVRCDLRDRAIPWTRLSLERGGLPRDMNVSPAQRLAALSAGSASVSLLIAVLLLLGGHAGLTLPGALFGLATAGLASMTALNARWYRFLQARRGLLFALRAVPVQALYYHYSVLGLLIGMALHARDTVRERRQVRAGFGRARCVRPAR